MFKRTILAAVAFSMLAVPMASAQPRHDGPGRSHHVEQFKPKPQNSRRAERHDHRKYQWRKGQRVKEWRRHAPVRDYHRHGLRRPDRGQQWIRVGNDYVLVSIATGLILGLAAAY